MITESVQTIKRLEDYIIDLSKDGERTGTIELKKADELLTTKEEIKRALDSIKNGYKDMEIWLDFRTISLQSLSQYICKIICIKLFFIIKMYQSIH